MGEHLQRAGLKRDPSFACPGWPQVLACPGDKTGIWSKDFGKEQREHRWWATVVGREPENQVCGGRGRDEGLSKSGLQAAEPR